MLPIVCRPEKTNVAIGKDICGRYRWSYWGRVQGRAQHTNKLRYNDVRFARATLLYARVGISRRRVSIRLSHAGIVSQQLNVGSR